ncbi:hypothetical protein [Winogradskyella sp.]|uniref:hypothetical protein n=1 Tax=Winogradskyella sp. TaxID=1883156 RepID=UPI001B1B1FF9|nr:hypothetical protein [Winogradskyella sp.]MBO6881451.1 hypothetical protein [Winogradskyella sp.]
MSKQIKPTSKKREILYVDKHITDKKTEVATEVLSILSQYKNTYQQQIKQDATIDEIVQAIKEGDKTKLIETKHAKDKEKLQENFTNLNEQTVLDVLRAQSKEVVDNLVKLGTAANYKLKGSGLTVDNFVLNDEFIMNSKVTGRIKNMAAIYCTNETQLQLRNLAIQISDLIKGGLKSGLLASNRLGTIGEHIVDVNTGEIKHQYIMRC